MIAALSDEIEGLLAAQEEFEALREQTLLRAGRQLCDLSYANAFDGPPAPVVEALREALDARRELDLQYTPYGGSTLTRRLVARQLAGSHRAPFHWREVVLTPGAMAGLNLLFRALRRESARDEVVCITPCWIDYPLYLANLGLVPRFVPLRSDTLRLDLDAIRDALGPDTRAVILSQPANPTGLVYSREELRALGALLAEASPPPVLVSDECHRDVLFEPEAFSSPVEHYPATCVVHSFGKSLFMQGQRIGYVAVSPRFEGGRALARSLERLCRVMGFCTPTALMQLAIRRLLDAKPDLSAVAARRKRAVEALVAAGFRLVPSQATFFLYPAADGPDDAGFVRRLAARGVLALPAAVFYHRGHFRLSLTASDEMLDRALPLLAQTLAGEKT